MHEVTAFRNWSVSGHAVVSAPAEVDIRTAELFRRALATAAGLSSSFVIADMGHTRACDSAAVAMLIGLSSHLSRAGGELRLVVCEPGLLRVLAVTDKDRALHVFTSLPEALAAARQESGESPVHPARPDYRVVPETA